MEAVTSAGADVNDVNDVNEVRNRVCSLLNISTHMVWCVRLIGHCVNSISRRAFLVLADLAF